MKPIPSLLTMALLGIGGGFAAVRSVAAQSSASSQGAPAQAALRSGTVIDASLSTTLDAKKNKAGDRVEAHTVQDVKQDGQVVLKKGTRLTGHVTEAEARTKDQPQSSLGIVFDQAIMKNGEQAPIGLIVQALAPSQVSPAAGSDDAFGSGSGLSGVSQPGLGDDANPVPPTVPSGGAERVPSNSTAQASTAAGNARTAGGLTPSGRLAPNSSGVFGLDGLSLRNVASSATEGSMILSQTKNVHLDSGTQVLFVVASPAQ